ncbi:acid sphingomyelinase-like phosphodiesterase 3b isoform X2 [Amphibalanus amphitrite]|nr:acid sphingomyelinase-like phosphodiesterase 3b isoform X2 [Amphibalanus amphitrite]
MGRRPRLVTPPLVLVALVLVMVLQTAETKPPLQITTTAGQFWQITDIHWDWTYNRTGDVSSWCHGAAGDPTADNGLFGNYSCDAPWVLVKEAVRHMAQVQPQPDFVIWTGDNAPHWEEGPEFKQIFSAIDNITRVMEEAFPDTPIVPCLGNHDSFPADFYPGGNKSFYTRYLTEGGWSRLLSEDEQRTFATAGYFARRLTDQLTIISLNTNIYYRPNEAIDPKEADPGQQFSWLRDQLKNASTEGYKVIIGAHIAPGFFERQTDDTFMFDNYNEALLALIGQYSDVILAQVYGHEHTDSFRVLGQEAPDGELQLQAAMFLAPSVTPWVPAAGTNPGVRLYSYTPTVLTDYSQYILNLTASNAAGAAAWSRLYAAADTYSLSDLGVQSMAALYRRLVAEPALFDTYYRLNTAGAPVGETCDLPCKRSQLCAIGHLRTDAMATCLNSVTTMNSIISGEMLVHGPAGGPGSAPVAGGSGRPSQFLAVFFGVIAGLAALAALVAFVVVRVRKRPSAPSTVLRNVASFVSVGSQGYETMT